MKNISAFPHENFLSHRGMTLRDYFASKAMQGMFASGNLPKSVGNDEVAQVAYQMADAMMKAREE
jgi:NADH dehydrogenase FAD-containing subunit